MEKKINLEEILFNSKFKDLNEREKQSIKNGLVTFNFDEIIWAIKESCRRVLELAAENATLLEGEEDIGKTYLMEQYNTFYEDVLFTVNKESILNTINQIE